MTKFIKVIAAVALAAIGQTLFAYNGGYENSSLTDITIGGTTYKGYGNNTVTKRTESGTTIAANAYAQCSKLTSVSLANVTSIGNAAFAYSALTSVELPATLKSLGYIAFGGCKNLSSITINSTAFMTSADEAKEPFRDCTALKTVTAKCDPPSWDFKKVFPAVTTVKVPQANLSVWKNNCPTLNVQAIVTETTVSFSKSGGTGGSDKVTATVGAAMPAITVPTRAGYAFGGYRASAADGNVLYYDTAGKSLRNWDKSVTSYSLYAVWTAVKSTAVTFSKSGGTGGSDKVTATVGVAMPAITIPTRKGYIFSGYRNSSADGNVRYYDSNGKSLRNWDKSVSSYSLFAIWTKEYHTTISLSKSGGSGGDDKVVATYTLSLPKVAIPMRTGYAFGGYRSSSTDGNILYYDENGKSLKNWAKTVTTYTLYAIWTKTSTTAITLGKSGGTGGSDKVTATVGAAMPAITVPTRAGYAFCGYRASAVDGNVLYYDAAGKSLRNWDKSVTSYSLYAVWTVAAKQQRAFAPDILAGTWSYASEAKSLFEEEGYVSGLIADGSGEFEMLVKEGGKAGFIRILYDDGLVVFGECEVEMASEFWIVYVGLNDLMMLVRPDIF